MYCAVAHANPATAALSFEESVASMAAHALLREAEAAPKPGLVDRLSSGAHGDMDIGHFRASAGALRPFFQALAEAGLNLSGAGEALDLGDARKLRNLGLAAERAMLEATGGVNTHKGALWSLGLLCAAAGRLFGQCPVSSPRRAGLSAETLCCEAASLASALVGCPAPSANGLSTMLTNGRKSAMLYGLRSAQDEALQAFPSIRALALPLARAMRRAAYGPSYLRPEHEALASHRFPVAAEDEEVILVLLACMAHADDTCIVARGGIEALTNMRKAARAILAAREQGGEGAWKDYQALLGDFKKRRLSPGGSADLCAATLFLVDVEGTLFSALAPHEVGQLSGQNERQLYEAG